MNDCSINLPVYLKGESIRSKPFHWFIEKWILIQMAIL